MSIALRSGMTAKEFLAWEERQEIRHEFDGCAPYAMTGGTRNHAAIQSGLITALRNRLRGSPCEVFGSALKMSVDGSLRYPDAVVVCTRAGGKTTVVDDPVVVFEIIRPSTERVDRFVKSVEYRNTPSIQAYVMLQQDFIGATMLRRVGEVWTADTYGEGATVGLAAIGVGLPVDELYEGLDLSA